jgi:hypothetical protein
LIFPNWYLLKQKVNLKEAKMALSPQRKKVVRRKLVRKKK